MKKIVARFDLGKQTRHKADPRQVSNNMQKATGEQNRGLLREEEEADRQYLIEEVTKNWGHNTL